MADAIELAAGRAYRVRLQGSKRVDPIVVDKVEGGQASYRLTWTSKGERVLGKPHTRPVGEVEVISALDLDRLCGSPARSCGRSRSPRRRRSRSSSASDPPGEGDHGGLSVFTASFGAVVPGLVVPVLTTVGTPRFVSFPMVEWRTVAPYGLLDVTDPDEFRRKYRHRLRRLTPKILAELRELCEAYAPLPLALCCFERDPADCHRSILGEWLAEKGVTVTELP